MPRVPIVANTESYRAGESRVAELVRDGIANNQPGHKRVDIQRERFPCCRS
jgi:hypothetical protein